PIEHFGSDHPWSNRINADVLFREFERDRFGQPFERVCGRYVNADLREADVTCNARGIDDCAATVLEHHWNLVAHRTENAPNVDVENVSILGCSRLVEWTLPFDASIVECDVESAEFVDRKLYHRS